MLPAVAKGNRPAPGSRVLGPFCPSAHHSARGPACSFCYVAVVVVVKKEKKNQIKYLQPEVRRNEEKHREKAAIETSRFMLCVTEVTPG